jgi:hypothetical protein
LPRSEKPAATPQSLVPDEDRSGPNPAFDAEAYNAVGGAAKLRRILLLRSNFVMQPEYIVARGEKNAAAPKPRYFAEFGTHHVNGERGLATCEWKWGIKVIDKRKTTLSIESGLSNYVCRS